MVSVFSLTLITYGSRPLHHRKNHLCRRRNHPRYRRKNYLRRRGKAQRVRGQAPVQAPGPALARLVRGRAPALVRVQVQVQE